MEGIIRLIEAIGRWFRQDEPAVALVPIPVRSNTRRPGQRRRR